MVRSAESPDSLATLDLTALRIGSVLRLPIYESQTDRDVLLLAEGAEVTADQLERLARRGVTHVRVHRSELARLTQLKTPSAVDRVDRPRAKPASGVPFLQQVRRHGSRPYDALTVAMSAGQYREAADQAEMLFQALAQGCEVDGDHVVAGVQQALEQMAADRDLFVSLGIASTAGARLHEHSLRTSRMAVAIGATLGLCRRELLELGIGCLVHDVGMQRIDRRIYEAERVLSPVEFLEITKHPAHTFDMIKDVRAFSIGARMVAYQLHERWNGSGYPRQRQGPQIHPLARIAAVADVFIARISPRPYRPARLPYEAMLELIRGCHAGLFEPGVVRTLLHTVALFPVGSCVELSDGRLARVIRANGAHYTRPVVQPVVPEDDGASGPDPLDLSDEHWAQLHVARAIPSPEAGSP